MAGLAGGPGKVVRVAEIVEQYNVAVVCCKGKLVVCFCHGVGSVMVR